MDAKINRNLKYPYQVKITWERDPHWGEICAWALEHFGLPGGRFVTNPTRDYLQFNFVDNRDRLLFVTAWGHDGL